MCWRILAAGKAYSCGTIKTANAGQRFVMRDARRIKWIRRDAKRSLELLTVWIIKGWSFTLKNQEKVVFNEINITGIHSVFIYSIFSMKLLADLALPWFCYIDRSGNDESLNLEGWYEYTNRGVWFDWRSLLLQEDVHTPTPGRKENMIYFGYCVYLMGDEVQRIRSCASESNFLARVRC